MYYREPTSARRYLHTGNVTYNGGQYAVMVCVANSKRSAPKPNAGRARPVALLVPLLTPTGTPAGFVPATATVRRQRGRPRKHS